jgi:Fe2+ or Zn2+ uptake regulation protein
MMYDSVEALLTAHGVKPTPQRVVITQFLVDAAKESGHPTAEEVLTAVADALPVPMSRATVYNTLNTLVQAGVLREMATEPGRARYDANLADHHHFVDVKTGKILDIPWEHVSQLCESLGEEYQIKDYQITFYGEYRPKPS